MHVHHNFFVLCRGSKGRSVWFFIHWLLGTAVCLLGVLNIYTGLQAYHEKTSRGIRFWTIIFTAEMSFLAFFYLFQDKWLHIQRQGVVLGNDPIMPNDQEISPRDKQKELKILTCWGWKSANVSFTNSKSFSSHFLYGYSPIEWIGVY